ncbi:MAG TPA: hypothetical protein DCY94_03950 [Firmicutes bacterium]|nr:hypothetical protein [Bacillota bacterium]
MKLIQKLIDELLKNVREYITDEKGISEIEESIAYARERGIEVRHYDDSPFLLHSYRTAIIMTELHSDVLAIVSSLVWWLPIYSDNTTFEDLENKFGVEVAEISKSLSKTASLRLKDNLENSAINLRKILVGLSTDVRVIIIKLASRLDNLRNVYNKPSERQKEKCLETENVLIPIAHRLGINYIKSELEDLCLKYLHPDAYNEILDQLEVSYEILNKYIEIMKSELSEMMEREGISFRIKGRVKSVHSLYEKLSKGKRWKDIYDILALRIIVQKESECYLAIGLIHSKYRPIPKRFKDYIAQPKENMYQSLHTGVIGPSGKVFEIQIRTEEMDEIAECGIASHWSYKEHGTKAIQSLMEQKLELFRETMEATEKQDDDEVESKFKEVFSSNMVYVFTPAGEVIELPEGSTPVDLAYKIHSHIGDTMVGALVNGEIVPIDYQLKNDDIVKINTNESSTPNREWLKFVKTSQARNRIKSYHSKQDREEYKEIGLDLLNKEFKRRKLSVNETLNKEKLDKVIKELKLADMDELALSIGSLKYTAKYITNLLTEEEHDSTASVIEKISTSSNSLKDENYMNDIIVQGCDNIVVTIANCCKPVYGDDIIGYITKGNGITVHKSTCENLENMDERFIDVSWNEASSREYLAKVTIHTKNIGNNILDIVTKSSQRNLYIESIVTREHKDNIDYEVLIKVKNASQLRQFIIDVEGLDYVTGVESK